MDVKEYIQQASEVHGFALEVARAMTGIQQMPEFSSEEMRLTVPGHWFQSHACTSKNSFSYNVSSFRCHHRCGPHR